MLITFFWAYFFNDFVFAANINKFGEAHIEIIILPVSFIIGLYAIYGIMRQLRVNDRISD